METNETMETSEILLKDIKNPRPNPRSDVWKELLFLIIKIAAILLAIILLFTFLYGALRYSESAMNPALKDGDFVVFYRFAKNIYRSQDVIVLRVDGQKQVRRVIATAGDVVDITEEGLLINGALQQEPGIYQQTQRFQTDVEFPLTVPQGHVFVLADSRAGAEDSRAYGSIRIEDTLGKVMMIFRRRLI